MPPFNNDDLRYTLTLLNHQTGQRLKVEMIDLPFPCRSYRLRVNGQWAKKLPVASKTAAMRQITLMVGDALKRAQPAAGIATVNVAPTHSLRARMLVLRTDMVF